MWSTTFKFLSPVLGRIMNNNAASYHQIRNRLTIHLFWNLHIGLKHVFQMMSTSTLHSSNKVPGEMISSCRHFSQRTKKIKKECEHIGCSKRASRGYPGEPALTCYKHRKEGMIDQSKITCGKCLNVAHYGIPEGRRQFCLSHKL